MFCKNHFDVLRWLWLWSYGTWIYNYLYINATKFVSSNSARGEVDSKQFYVIKFVSDLRQVSGFFWELWISPPIKLVLQFNWNDNDVVFDGDFLNEKLRP